MTTEPRAPSVFQRAEGGSRQVVLQIGLGAVAFVVGSIFSAGATVRLAERVGFIESEAVAFAVGWLLQRLWLFVAVPTFGWAIGRFTEIRALRFALTACLSGEVFAVLLFTGINGFEALVVSPADVVARLVTLIIGMAVTLSAVSSGRAAAREAQLAANEEASKRKAEYAEYLAKQEQVGAAPASGADSGPRSD